MERYERGCQVGVLSWNEEKKTTQITVYVSNKLFKNHIFALLNCCHPLGLAKAWAEAARWTPQDPSRAR